MQGYLEIENSLYDLLITQFFLSCLVYHRALSGILFLQKDNQHQGLIKNHFSTEDLKMIHKATKSEITSGKISFNQNLYFSIKEAIDKFEEDEEELDFSINLLALCKTADQYEARAIKAIVYLFPELISVKNRTISEAHLSASFVHPVIRSLFSSPNDISHCSNLHQTDLNRPDYKVDKYTHYQYSSTPVFGELKTSAYSSNTKLLITDLYRLAIFMKNEIDEKNLRLTIGFQVVGLCLYFYAMELTSSRIYKFVELFSVQLPKNINNLQETLLLLDPISNISRIYKEKCVKSAANLQPFQCPTLLEELLDDLLVKLIFLVSQSRHYSNSLVDFSAAVYRFPTFGALKHSFGIG
ncbi:hypothetical protein MFLAVUS_010555 [Mucor flavus]|uniref:Uncharacterized protein n=1 Tax=Mucor flavus TaxID=439312 RepID=A0ABP9ZD26_9FUNG